MKSIAVKSPSEFCLAAESTDYHAVFGNSGYGAAEDGCRVLHAGLGSGAYAATWFESRLHSDRRNTLLVDGHVESCEENEKTFFMGRRVSPSGWIKAYYNWW